MSWTIEIHPEKDLSSEREAELRQWFQNEFGSIPLQWSKPEWYVLAFSQSNLIGRVGILKRSISVEGTPFEIAGITGMITGLEWRGLRIGTRMLERATEFIRDEMQVAFALLLCRMRVASFYAKLGWKSVEGPTVFEQPSGKVVFPRLTMVLQTGNTPWPKGTIDLCGLPW